MFRKLFAALLLTALVGCSAREAPYEDIDKAAGLFFERLRGAQYELIYSDSSDAFQSQKTRAEVVENLKQITAVGRPQDYDRLKMLFDKDGKKRIAIPTYSVDLDKSRVEMTLTFRDDGGEWKLLGFALKTHGPRTPSS